MSLPLAERHGRWTVSDLRRVPEDELNRYEIDDGVVVVSPRLASPHQSALLALAALLRDAIKAAEIDLRVVPEVDVTTGRRDDWLKVPDIVVVTKDAYDCKPQEYDASDVVLAIEISGNRQSSKRDLGEKRDAYAEVEIANYWVLELEPSPKLTALKLTGDAYETVAIAHSLVRLTEPFEIDIDPTDLEW